MIESQLSLLEDIKAHFVAILNPMTSAVVDLDGVPTEIPIPKGAVPVPFDPSDKRNLVEKADALVQLCNDYLGGVGIICHSLRSAGTPSDDGSTPSSGASQ